MQSALDAAITKAAASEATYNGDTDNVNNIQAGILSATTNAQTAIETATAPLAPAQQKQGADAVTLNQDLDALSVAALAAKVPTGTAVLVP